MDHPPKTTMAIATPVFNILEELQKIKQASHCRLPGFIEDFFAQDILAEGSLIRSLTGAMASSEKRLANRSGKPRKSPRCALVSAILNYQTLQGIRRPSGGL